MNRMLVSKRYFEEAAEAFSSVNGFDVICVRRMLLSAIANKSSRLLRGAYEVRSVGMSWTSIVEFDVSLLRLLRTLPKLQALSLRVDVQHYIVRRNRYYCWNGPILQKLLDSDKLLNFGCAFLVTPRSKTQLLSRNLCALRRI